MLIYGIAGIFPLLTWFVQWRLKRGWREMIHTLILFGVGLIITGPFLNERWVGRGDAANYAEAVADTVVQLRAGVFPVYVGQSDFAFNGRIHPLRTAMYFNYCSGFLDLITFHRLSYWGLQNLLLTLSLAGGIFSAYGCLMALGTLSSSGAAALALVYGLSPGLLAPAFGQDLYMTVTTAPFLPLVLLALAKYFHGRTRSSLNLLAVAIAATWLAHPPVAAWLTLGCGIVLLIGWVLRFPKIQEIKAILLAILVGSILCGYVFVSALSLNKQKEAPDRHRARLEAVAVIESSTKGAFEASLRPVSRNPMTLGDFQLGYICWALLGLAIFNVMSGRRSLAGAFLASIGVYLLIVIPVPFLHRQFWTYVPSEFISLTNIWPMQRAYIVLTIWVIFAFALSWPVLSPYFLKVKANSGRLILIGAFAWMGWQAWAFIERGYSTRRSRIESIASQRLENINLTSTSYALLGVPETFTFSTMDPEHEFRLLSREGNRDLPNNWDAHGLQPLVSKGTFRVQRRTDTFELQPKLTLQPNKKYRLRFHFLVPEFTGLLFVRGHSISREYVMPFYLAPKGFGMMPSNNHAIVIWTTENSPQEIYISVQPNDGPHREWAEFATYELEEIDRSQLPIRLDHLVPNLRCTVRSPENAWLLSPRMHIRGYKATVDGKDAEVAKSEDGVVMIAVPQGEHIVEIRYAGFPLLHFSFFTALIGWIGVAASAGRKFFQLVR